MFFTSTVVGFFRADPEVIAIGGFALTAQCVALFFQPLSVCANMLFQSIGQNRSATLLSTLRSGLVFIPVLVVLSQVMGLTGVQVAQTVADVITFFICLPFVVRFFGVLKEMEAGEVSA